MFSLICVWINGWVNNREAGDLRRHRGHYDVNVMHDYFIRQICKHITATVTLDLGTCGVAFQFSFMSHKLAISRSYTTVLVMHSCCHQNSNIYFTKMGWNKLFQAIFTTLAWSSFNGALFILCILYRIKPRIHLIVNVPLITTIKWALSVGTLLTSSTNLLVAFSRSTRQERHRHLTYIHTKCWFGFFVFFEVISP